jgi:hypothetical protein
MANPLRDSPENKRRQLNELTILLQTARRMHEMDLAQLMMPATLPNGPDSIAVNGDPFQPHTPRLWAEPEPAELQRLREEVDAIRLEKFRLLRAAYEERQRPLINLLLQRLELAYYFAKSPEEYCRQTLAWQLELDAEFARVARLMEDGQESRIGYNRNRLAREQGKCVAALLAQRRLVRHLSTADDEPRTWPPDQLVPLWSELTRHARVAIRAVGLAGLTDLPDDRGLEAALAALTCLEQIPTSEDLGFPDNALERVVLARLKAAGKLAEVIERRINEAEQQQDPRRLWNMRPRFREMVWEFSPARSGPRESWVRRAIALVDNFHPINDEEKQDTARQRGWLIDMIVASSKPVPSDLQSQAPTSGPWTHYQAVPLRFDTPANLSLGQLLGAVVEHELPNHELNPNLLVFWNTGAGKVWIGRTGITGGKVQEVGQLSFNHDGQNFHRRLTATTGGGSIFISAGAGRLAVIGRDGVQVFGQAEGFPGQRVPAMAWLDGALYLSLLNGLARFDPHRESFEMLASNLTVDAKGPLDGGAPYQLAHLLADPEHHQLWLALNGDNDRSGIWKFTPSVERWKRVFAARDNGYISNLWWSNDKIRFVADFAWRELDPVRGVASEVKGLRPFERTNTTRFSAFYEQSGDHIMGLDGILYDADGREWRYPIRSRWEPVGQVSNGFLVLDHNEGLILFQRRSVP